MRKKFFFIVGILVIGTLLGITPPANATGSTYFTDTDNWGGGNADSVADGDLDIELKNANSNVDSKYPIEVKIENVTNLPQKNAHLLIRAYDVDEYRPQITSTGEWNRVYFSSNPSDIVLGPNYTPFPWIPLTDIYKREIPSQSYLGTLVGENNKWSTTVLPFEANEWSRIAQGDNYAGLTIHHYYKATGNVNTGWALTVDWIQLIIDGGEQEFAEITNTTVKVENGKILLDTSFLSKISGDFSMEVFITEEVLEEDIFITRTVGQTKKLFNNINTMQQIWKNIEIINSQIRPTNNYQISFILSEDRGGGLLSESYTNPGKVQHLISFSTNNLATPVIDLHPVGATVTVDDANPTINVGATVSDGGPLNYQWYSNSINNNTTGAIIDGATSPTYIVPTGVEGTTYYYAVVANRNGGKTAVSNPAKMEVIAKINVAPPMITKQPSGAIVLEGSAPPLLHVDATTNGSGTLSYQWYSATTNDPNDGVLIDGATNPRYEAPTSIEGTTYYYCIVTNTDNNATGQKTATEISDVVKVQVNALTHAEKLSVMLQPANQTVNIGEPAILSVIASGGASLSYQWYSSATNVANKGMPINGAINASYLAPTNTEGITYYYSVVTNTDSSATGNQITTTTSDVAKVQVNALTNATTPSIITQPANQIVNRGEAAILSVVASGGVSLSYQWYSSTTNDTNNGTLINGATNATYLAPTNVEEEVYYYCIVTNTDNNATGTKTAAIISNIAKIQVKSMDVPPIRGSYSPPSTVKIILHTNDGIILEPIEITYNTKISDLPVPTREGYRFDGWYQDKALTKRWEEETLARENIELYAKWIKLPQEESETAQESPLPSMVFSDMESHWANEIVHELVALGIIQGYEDGTFRPNEAISRMHVTALLTRAFAFEKVRTAIHFSDVSPTHPYYKEITVLQQAGIIDGKNGEFLPAEKMTRAQLAKVLAGVLGLTPEGTSSFADVDSQHWSAGYIAVLEREGIAFGDNGNFRPGEPVTRAQFAALLYRITQFQEE
ncbi:S-layer homology domain-containing protein [Metasolibacillus fluoroglycofenilyticus]|uniref:S-layer homology domain-containing protein n=1 Tax=Metasolibacillus fluoroglycofenilyticus TaxID=1239396 RepID=UPI001F17E163|nr:S-layer homology domain-containing protein [Metasolibacillus fluoroglycofenilyticus]